MRSRHVVRRLGGLALLLVWMQVATANALPCALWCELAGDTHVVANPGPAEHQHHQTQPSHGTHCQTAFSGTNVGAPQILAVAVVPGELPQAPRLTIVADDPVATLTASFISSFPGFDPPPPRV